MPDIQTCFFRTKLSSFQSKGKVDMGQICEFVINHHSEGAPVLSLLYKVAVTAGYASARVEWLFSALTKIDSPQRRSMTKRESNLTFLHFGRETFNDFLSIWNKPRKLSFT